MLDGTIEIVTFKIFYLILRNFHDLLLFNILLLELAVRNNSILKDYFGKSSIHLI